MKIKQFCSFIVILISFVTYSQKLSEKAEVSVITCGPGAQLFTAFGHSAFRISDPVLKIDKIYNYGTFNFNAPNFYLNFAKGKLTYQLSTSPFSYFLRVYKYENRWVKSQVLNLKPEELQAFYDFLQNNAKPQNRDYQYDFFYDNCSTKIEAVIKTILKEKVHFNNDHITSSKTHRDLIADYTVDQKWGKFGIDLALGSVIDRTATKDEYKFLPDYIFQAMDNATIKIGNTNEPLVLATKTFLNSNKTNSNLLFSYLTAPISILTILSLIVGFITFKNFRNKQRSRWLDFSLHLITGIIGIAVLLLWFATDHTATYKNLNFLWAFAPNTIVAFYMLKAKLPQWIGNYHLFLLLLLGISVLIWLFKIQVYNIAIAPLLIALGLRYFYIFYTGKKVLSTSKK
ncbi:DUF4105 domain-containing protein [uncultured Lutibacter sp.]|uniref:lipoprotein N-acyltransferase Lnb domain-containing protein n=1 Tax=uncultured Lutibacter sp. TaxID=437739 RepID=UPI002637CC31|nr:DUF4105 domain-containing protein [uncultured Lutibacter sp.]